MKSAKFALVFFTSALIAERAAAQGYTTGSPIDPGVIKHAIADSVIGPTDRTNVGISESVVAWVEDAEDWDLQTDESSSTQVQDNLGSVTWSISGPGGTVYPAVASYGQQVSIYVDLSDSDYSLTINADVDDAFTFANDAPKPAAAKNLNAKVPTGVDVVSHYNAVGGNPPPQENPNGDKMYADAFFRLEVMPKTVDFKNLPTRENYWTQTFQNWPDDGPNYTIAAKTKAITLVTGPSQFPPGTQVNLINAFQDHLAQPLTNRSRLVTAQSCATCHGAGVFPPGVPMDYEIPLRVPYEYKSSTNPETWKQIVESIHRKKFRGADGKAQVRLEATSSDESAWMGPWFVQ